jgi:hypothetical protein
MSRGLGKLQRAILEALPTTEIYAGVYDLSALKRALAEPGSCYTASFEAAFSRAVRTLMARGLLQRHLIMKRWVVKSEHVPAKR